MLFDFYPSIPDFSQKRFLLTGGAGFIGSHVLDFLIASKAKSVLVLDNLCTGRKENIGHHLHHSHIQLHVGDILQVSDCMEAARNVDCIIHLAALGSVPRSVANPIASHEANSTGFLNILWAAKEQGVPKVVYASSSSVYGDNPASPKVEGFEGKPLSPYAFTKQSNEAYAKLFFDLYGVETIGLRFFNIFGKRQNKDGPYAAFVPLAIHAAQSGQELAIYGDGTQSRDFTHVANAVWAVSSAVEASRKAAGKAFNIACGASTSLLDVVGLVEQMTDKKIKTTFLPPRKGDIKDSLADVSNAAVFLNFSPICNLEKGLGDTVA